MPSNSVRSCTFVETKSLTHLPQLENNTIFIYHFKLNGDLNQYASSKSSVKFFSEEFYDTSDRVLEKSNCWLRRRIYWRQQHIPEWTLKQSVKDTGSYLVWNEYTSESFDEIFRLISAKCKISIDKDSLCSTLKFFTQHLITERPDFTIYIDVAKYNTGQYTMYYTIGTLCFQQDKEIIMGYERLPSKTMAGRFLLQDPIMKEDGPLIESNLETQNCFVGLNGITSEYVKEVFQNLELQVEFCPIDDSPLMLKVHVLEGSSIELLAASIYIPAQTTFGTISKVLGYEVYVVPWECPKGFYSDSDDDCDASENEFKPKKGVLPNPFSSIEDGMDNCLFGSLYLVKKEFALKI